MRFYMVRNLTKATDVRDHVVRVYNGNLEKIGERISWVKIKANRRTIYRMIRGGGRIDGLDDKTIEIDYNGRSSLRIVKGSGHAANVSTCNSMLAQFNHPNERHRWIVRLSVVAVIVTLISLIRQML